MIETRNKAQMMNRFVVLSGCSGGGKSTLLTELRRRGFAVVDEPGRRIVKEEAASGGEALPWVDLAAFARRAIEVALADLKTAAEQKGWVFFDRSLVDAAVALQHVASEPALAELATEHRYFDIVFLTPPWPELFATDAERRHSLSDAVAEYDRLQQAYCGLGYRTVVLPRISVSARADLVLNEVSALAQPIRQPQGNSPRTHSPVARR